MTNLNEQLRAEFESIAEKYDINVTLLPADLRKDEPYKYVHTNHLFAIFCEGARRAPAAAPAPVAAIDVMLPDAEEYFREQLSKSGLRKYLADEAISLKAPVWCEIMQDYARAALAAAPPAPAAAPIVQPVETEMADRLRRIALNRGEGPISVQPKLLIQAADECDRFYNGMMNWKANAQAKDRTIIELRAAPTPASSTADAKDAALRDIVVLEAVQERRADLVSKLARTGYGPDQVRLDNVITRLDAAIAAITSSAGEVKP